MPGDEELAKHVPRSDNSAADAAANHALDNDTRFLDVRVDEATAFALDLSAPHHEGIGLLFSFDGAARGNPGPSASGVCAWWGYSQSGKFLSKGCLLQRGYILGIGTNNSSEAHGLALALKSCLHYFLWLIEQLSMLAQHTVREA